MSKLGRLPSIVLTFFLVMIGWVFFRIETMDTAYAYVLKLIAFDQFTVQNISSHFMLILVFASIFSWITLTKFGKRIEQFIFYKSNYTTAQFGYITALSILLFIISIARITTADFNPFIYFRF